MEDWAYGLAIVLWAILWVTIFVDYRKKLIMVLPSVEEVSTRKHSFSSKISAAEDSAQQVGQRLVRRQILCPQLRIRSPRSS
jgi:hypothetical protein